MLTVFRDYLFELSPNCIKLLVLQAEKEIHGWEQNIHHCLSVVSCINWFSKQNLQNFSRLLEQKHVRIYSL